MKMKDLVVGRDYAAGHNRVRVIEKGRYRRVWVASGRWGSFQKSQNPDGVQVEYLKDDGTPVVGHDGITKMDVIGTRAIDSTWVEKVQANHDRNVHEMAVKANREVVRQEFEVARAFANTFLEKAIDASALHTDQYGRTTVTLTPDQFTALAEGVLAMPTGKASS